MGYKIRTVGSADIRIDEETGALLVRIGGELLELDVQALVKGIADGKTQADLDERLATLAERLTHGGQGAARLLADILAALQGGGGGGGGDTTALEDLLKALNPPTCAAGMVYLAEGNFSDGDALTISDGEKAVRFEFDDDEEVQGGSVPVPIGGGEYPGLESIANLAGAVNGVEGFTVTGGANGGQCALANEAPGAAGNVPITTTPAFPAGVSGMEGAVDGRTVAEVIAALDDGEGGGGIKQVLLDVLFQLAGEAYEGSVTARLEQLADLISLTPRPDSGVELTPGATDQAQALSMLTRYRIRCVSGRVRLGWTPVMDVEGDPVEAAAFDILSAGDRPLDLLAPAVWDGENEEYVDPELHYGSETEGSVAVLCELGGPYYTPPEEPEE